MLALKLENQLLFLAEKMIKYFSTVKKMIKLECKVLILKSYLFKLSIIWFSTIFFYNLGFLFVMRGLSAVRTSIVGAAGRLLTVAGGGPQGMVNRLIN